MFTKRLTSKVGSGILRFAAPFRRHTVTSNEMSISDSEDEDLKRAIAMSLQESSPQVKQPTPEQQSVSSNSMPPAVSSMASIFGDRKATEEERLARVKKRERPFSPPAVSRKAPKLDSDTADLPSGAQLRMFSSTVQGDQKQRKSAVANAANGKLQESAASSQGSQSSKANRTATQTGTMRYPRGVVKKTWAFGFQRTDDDIKLEEVLEASTLKTAVLSAFQWNMDWILAKLKTPLQGGKTKCIFVMQAKETELRQQMLEETEPARSYLRLCFPPMEGQTHCMHSKLMLLFHQEKLRVAIPTANLLDFDWGETGVMENSVFLIDLPRLPETAGSPPQIAETLTSFGQELLFFLQKQGLGPDVLTGILNFDFSATADMAFIHAVGGITHDSDAQRTGIPGLARGVRKLNLQTSKDLQLDFAASSIGSLNDDFLRSVHSAARGTDMITQSATGATKAKANFFKPLSRPEQRLQESIDIRQKLRIYFPTAETVRASRAGAAGTICLSRKWFEAHNFPRSCFRDYVSTRKGLLSHNKILYARGRKEGSEEGEAGEGEQVAWAYVGSANMSESAWGKLVLDKKTKLWRVNCRNWECGVLLPVHFPKTAGDTDVGKGKEVAKVLQQAEHDPDETESEDESTVPAAPSKPPPFTNTAIATASGKAKARSQAQINDSETESEDDGEAAPKTAAISLPPPELEVFTPHVRPPFELPGRVYEGREPWYFTE